MDDKELIEQLRVRVEHLERTRGQIDVVWSNKITRLEMERRDDLAEGGLLYNHGTALSELEEKISEYCERLEALETAMDHGAANAEMQRRDRWHKTRDAVLTGCYAKPSGIGPFGLEYWMREATAAADRAHGPLEVKPEAKQNYLLVTREQVHYSVNIDHIDALVKAAREWKGWRQHGLASGWDKTEERECFERFCAALKPFEPAPKE